MEKRFYTVPEIIQMTGLSKQAAYNLTKQPGFPSFSFGRRTLVSVEGFEEWLRKQKKEEK